MAKKFSGDMIMDGMEQEGSLVVAILAGAIAAIVGAGAWMGITVATGLHVGYVALGIGALVGFAIRLSGSGTGIIFGIVGAVWTLLSCLTGEFLTQIQLATTPQHDFYAVLISVNMGDMLTTILNQTSPITYLIYAIGIFEGYKLSIRK